MLRPVGCSALRSLIAVALVLCTTFAATTADAHRLRVAITTLLFNDHSGRIEVMHRFYLHDAEHALTELMGRGADLFDSVEDRQRFAVYVHERFELGVLDDSDTLNGNKSPDENVRPLPLRLIGAEIEDDSLWVYQAIALPATPISGLQVSQRALQDIWPDQVNTVNIERKGRISTLTFRADTPTQSIRF
ncbi:MAG: DUF6702 family protein [Pseudomonadales bacterium]|nr:hypothetical protein [Pseudomonadales bacterium]